MRNIGRWIYKNARILKNIAIISIMFIGLLIYSYYIYHTYVEKIAVDKSPESSINYMNVEANSEEQLKQSDTIRQEFFGDYMGIAAIKVRLAKKQSGLIHAKLIQRNDNVVLQEWTKDLNEVKGDKLNLKLKQQIKNSKSVPYALELTILDSDKEVILYVTDQDVYPVGSCLVNDEEKNGDILFKVVPLKQNYSALKCEYWFFVIIMILVILYFVYMLRIRKQIKVEWLFLLFMFVYGGIYLFILPPFAAPDEPSHYATAYHTSNRILGVKETDDKLVTCRECDNDGILYITPNAESYRIVLNNLFRKAGNVENNTQFVLGDRIQQAVLVAHLPQAVGITIARLLDFNYITSIYLARMCSLLFYMIMVFWAIRMIPIGKYILFVLSGFPMVLQEAASCGYDIIVMGFVFFFSAYVLRFVYERRNISVRDIAAMMFLAILFSPCKLVYCVVPFLVLLIPAKAFRTKWRQYIVKIGVPLMGLFSAAICNMGTVSNSTGGTNYIEWAGQEGYTIGYLMHHILQTISIFVATVHDYMAFYVGGIIGDNLGWLNTSIPLEMTIAAAIIMVLAINTNEKMIQVRVRQKLLFLAIAGCSAMMICASMLLAWTPVTSNGILGIQGRYILPVLPLILLCFADRKRYTLRNRDVVLLGSCVVNFLVVVRVFEIVITR